MSHLRPYSISNALYRVFIRPAIENEVHRNAAFVVHRTFVPALQYQEKLSKKQREQSGILTPEDEERIRKAQEKKQRKEMGRVEPKKTPLPFIPGITKKPSAAVQQVEQIETHPENHDIEDLEISVVDQHGNYTRRARTRDVLRSLDLTVDRLYMVQPADPSDNRSLAVCKIEPVAEAMKRERLRQSRAAAKEKGEKSKKEIEMTWTIGANDLDIKMRQIRKFLMERRKVDVTLMKKHKRRPLGMEMSELIQLVNTIRRSVREIPGALESTKPDGKMGEELKLFFDGTDVQMQEMPDDSYSDGASSGT